MHMGFAIHLKTNTWMIDPGILLIKALSQSFQLFQNN